MVKFVQRYRAVPQIFNLHFQCRFSNGSNCQQQVNSALVSHVLGRGCNSKRGFCSNLRALVLYHCVTMIVYSLDFRDRIFINELKYNERTVTEITAVQYGWISISGIAKHKMLSNTIAVAKY